MNNLEARWSDVQFDGVRRDPRFGESQDVQLVVGDNVVYQCGLVDDRTGVEQAEGDAAQCRGSSRPGVGLDAAQEQYHRDENVQWRLTATWLENTAGCVNRQQTTIGDDVAEQR